MLVLILTIPINLYFNYSISFEALQFFFVVSADPKHRRLFGATSRVFYGRNGSHERKTCQVDDAESTAPALQCGRWFLAFCRLPAKHWTEQRGHPESICFTHTGMKSPGAHTWGLELHFSMTVVSDFITTCHKEDCPERVQHCDQPCRHRVFLLW